MAAPKRKTSARKKTAAKKITARKAPAKKKAEPEAKVQTSAEPQEGPVIVEAGGIDPRLVEQRDKQRELERGVRYAHHSEPAQLDPQLAKIRQQTIKQEAKLANRPLTEPPVKTSR